MDLEPLAADFKKRASYSSVDFINEEGQWQTD
jgi:hypothetical protein